MFYTDNSSTRAAKMAAFPVRPARDGAAPNCIAGREMGKILGKLGKRSLGGENENPVEEGFNEV